MAREYEDIRTTNMRPRGHSVVLDNRSRAAITGVTDVESFNETEVVLVTEEGIVTVIGQELHISRLSLEDGQLIVEGTVNGIEYSDDGPVNKGGGFMSKLFR